MEPKIYHEDAHGISLEQIDADALYVVEKLQYAGFTAYIVGGGVRDLVLGYHPKDIDIATSARPEQVKRLFRNCLLIGRRFRLAHIRFGSKIIEVATFRSGDTDEDELIVRDNNWGNPQEDAQRRDFTINGLFYNPLDGTIIDYVNGFEDLKHRKLTTIGHPGLRFKQDPVRMIRLIKFIARFDLQVDPFTWSNLTENCYEILKSSPARILEELLRMLESGYSFRFFELMHETKLIDIVWEELGRILDGTFKKNVSDLLKTADQIQLTPNYPKLTREVLFCCFLWPTIDQKLRDLIETQGAHKFTALAYDLIVEQTDLLTRSFKHFPRKFRAICEWILMQQIRLTPYDGKVIKNPRIPKHPIFGDALQLLALRARTNPACIKHYEKWFKQYHAHLVKRMEMPEES